MNLGDGRTVGSRVSAYLGQFLIFLSVLLASSNFLGANIFIGLPQAQLRVGLLYA